MTHTLIPLDRYISHSMKKVQGYLTALDARLIATLLSCQDKSNIEGHLGEIGVHHGRLFLMLALARRSGERSLGIDLFEDDAISQHKGRDRALFVNARRLGIKLSESEIYKTSSLDLQAADILARTTGPVRFWSVDGGHLYQHVENDLRLAERTLAPEGIIAADDFFNLRWVNVTFAIYDFIRKSTATIPFAITGKKLYLAPPLVAEKYQDALRRSPALSRHEVVQILGKRVLLVNQSRFDKGYDLLRHAATQQVSRLESIWRRKSPIRTMVDQPGH